MIRTCQRWLAEERLTHRAAGRRLFEDRALLGGELPIDSELVPVHRLSWLGAVQRDLSANCSQRKTQLVRLETHRDVHAGRERRFQDFVRPESGHATHALLDGVR